MMGYAGDVCQSTVDTEIRHVPNVGEQAHGNNDDVALFHNA